MQHYGPLALTSRPERRPAVQSSCAQAHNPPIQGQTEWVQATLAEPVTIDGGRPGQFTPPASADAFNGGLPLA